MITFPLRFTHQLGENDRKDARDEEEEEERSLIEKRAVTALPRAGPCSKAEARASGGDAAPPCGILLQYMYPINNMCVCVCVCARARANTCVRTLPIPHPEDRHLRELPVVWRGSAKSSGEDGSTLFTSSKVMSPGTVGNQEEAKKCVECPGDGHRAGQGLFRKRDTFRDRAHLVGKSSPGLCHTPSMSSSTSRTTF